MSAKTQDKCDPVLNIKGEVEKEFSQYSDGIKTEETNIQNIVLVDVAKTDDVKLVADLIYIKQEEADSNEDNINKEIISDNETNVETSPEANKHALPIQSFSNRECLEEYCDEINTDYLYYECAICIERFIMYDHFRRHVKTHVNDEAYKCKHCLRSLLQIRGPQLRIKAHRRCKRYAKHLYTEVNNSDATDQTSIPQETFESGGGSEQDVTKHREEKRYKCDICAKSFSKIVHLMTHSRLVGHKSRQFFKCDICEKDFCRKWHFSEHLKTHSGEQPFKCDVCKKSFSYKKTLNTHMLTHTDARPYSCDVCGKHFRHKAHCNDHIKAHAEKQLFSCEICAKCFSHKRSLNSHIRKHSGERPFKCEICEKYFSQKGYFNDHLRTHSGEQLYKCDTCGKRFFYKNKLNSHIVIHSDERPFQCYVCGKSYSWKKNFNEHLRTHSGERPYKCDICGKCFSYKMSLSNHGRIHSAE